MEALCVFNISSVTSSMFFFLSLFSVMMYLFWWLLYRGRFECQCGFLFNLMFHTLLWPLFHFQHPEKNSFANSDPHLIHIHSPPGSQTHAWTINSCTAINFAHSAEKIESPRFRQKKKEKKKKKKWAKNIRIKGLSYKERKTCFSVPVITVTRRHYWEAPFIEVVVRAVQQTIRQSQQGYVYLETKEQHTEHYTRWVHLLHRTTRWVWILIAVHAAVDGQREAERSLSLHLSCLPLLTDYWRIIRLDSIQSQLNPPDISSLPWPAWLRTFWILHFDMSQEHLLT